jgi:hypothetical protein
MRNLEYKNWIMSKSLFFAVILLLLFPLIFVNQAQAQTATKLQILLPGMTAAPGTSSGYTGTPFTQTAGASFQVVVNATDDNWNVVSISDEVLLSSSDNQANLPASTNLVNGTTTLTVTLNRTGSQTVSAEDLTDPSVSNIVSPVIDVVDVAFFTVTDIGDPIWYTPGEVTVGDLIQAVEIIAMDAQGHRVNSYTKEVTLSQWTDYGPGRIEPETIRLEAGKWKSNIQIYRAGQKTSAAGVTGDVWIRVNDDNIFGESNKFCALPRPYTRLMNLVPGETHFPGSLTGKTGTPMDQQANGAFNVNVYATDEYWNRVPNVSTDIAFTSSDPSAVLPDPTPLSGGHLAASVTLNSNGLQTVTAADNNNPSITPGVSASINVISYQLHHFNFDAISSPRTVGSSFTVTIRAVDAAGNPVTDYSGELDLNASTGVQTITPQIASMVNGIWTGQITLTKAGSFISLSAQDRTQPPHSGTSNQFTVQPGSLSRLQVLLPGETATPGISPGKTGSVSPILAGTNISVRVNAIDNWWNTISSVTHVVELSSSDESATLPPDAALFNGTRQFSVTLNGTGVQTVTAHDITQPSVSAGTSSQILVNPGDLSQFTFNTIVGPVTAGVPFAVNIVAEDESGNRLVDYSGNLTISASTGTGTISPVSIVINQGLYSGNVTLTKAENGVSLSVTDGTSPAHTGTSNQFRVNAGSLAKFQVIVPGIAATPGITPGYSGSPTDQLAGQPFPIQINGVDSHWNLVSSAQDSFGISSTDLTASLPGNTVLINGTRNLSVTLNSGGSHTVSAYHLNNPQIANGQSPLINIIPQNLDHFAFDQINGPVTAGQSFTVTIQAETNQNQIVGNFTGSVNLNASTGENTVSPDVAGPFVNGKWTGSITLTKAGSNVSVSASDEASTPHTGVSNLFNVNPGAFKKLQVLLPGEDPLPGVTPGKTGYPQDQLTGVQFDIRVRAVDDHWNLINQATDSIKITSTDSLILTTQKSKLVNGSVILSTIMGTVGNHTISASDITNLSINSDESSQFLVNPGALDHFEFETIDTQTAGSAFHTEIFAADGTGNPLINFNGHARLESSTGAGTIQPTEIDFVNGYWNGNITITKAAADVKLTVYDFAGTPHSGESNLFEVTSGTFTRLQILLPGEQSTPGVAPGKTGSVATQLTGDAVTVTVYAVDNWWNPVINATGLIGLSSTDISANIPLDQQLNTGSVTFSTFRFNSPGNWTVTASNKANSQISSATSPLVSVISGAVASFVFSPIQSPQYAGDTLQVTVQAVDGSGNVVTGYNESASMTASTGPGTIIVDDIQFNNGEWQGPILLTKAVQSVYLNIHDFADIVRGNSNPFTLLPGNLADIKILLPGETLTPGLASAKSGFPSPQTIGVTFQATVYATDAWYNLVSPDSISLHFSSTDPSAVLPGDTIQTKNTVTYSFTLLTTGKNQLHVTSTSHVSLSDSSSEFSVLTGQIHHFVFSNIDSTQTAGTPFNVRIEAHNEFDYILLDYEGELILSASTGNGTISNTGVTLANGYWEGKLDITKADTQVVLYAADYIPPPSTHNGYSNVFKVVPAELAGLQILLPGETATPGVGTGKKDAPAEQTAGVQFELQVRAVDQYWNLVPERQDMLSFLVSDSFAVKPDTISLENGKVSVQSTLRAAGKHQFTVEFLNNPSFESAESDSITINPNNFTQLLTLLPGEVVLPGDIENDPLKTPGRKNNPTKQTSGLAFPVEVQAVDDYWNLVKTAPTDQTRLFSTDNTAQIVPLNSNLSEGKTSYSVTLNQGGNQILRAIDNSNSNIRTSLDAQVEILVGGLHYELVIHETSVAAGDPFQMDVLFKNGNDETVINANHLVSLSVVDAANLNEVSGNLQFVSINLQNGKRSLTQTCTAVGMIRIKVEDEIGTDAAYSDPLEVLAGSVAEVNIQASKTEVRALEDLTLTVNLTDIAGNPVPDKKVKFLVVTGSGTLADSTSMSNNDGEVTVDFKAGRITETNTVRASVDSVYTDFEIVVNLTPSSLPDGVPINYPNPFGANSDETHIEYFLPENADVSLKIYDLFGNLVWSVNIPAGSPGGLGREYSAHANSVVWDGKNSNGQKVGNGGYILMAKATANGKVVMDKHRKIAVLR